MSETGLVYTFTTPKLQPLVTKPEGKNLIQVLPPTHLPLPPYPTDPHLQACLNAPEPADAANDRAASPADSPEESHQAPPAQMPQQQAMPNNNNAQNMQRNAAPQAQPYAMTADQQQALQYQAYLQQQQVQQNSAYPMPPQPNMHQRG